MNSRRLNSFKKLFRLLPEEVKDLARKNYKLWRRDPRHTSLHFKQLKNKKKHQWSIRIGNDWRALAVEDGDDLLWYWIGSHEEYNILIKRINPKR